MTFACHTAARQTTQLAAFQLVYGRHLTTPSDAMLRVDNVTTRSESTDYCIQKAEEIRQLPRKRIRSYQDAATHG